MQRSKKYFASFIYRQKKGKKMQEKLSENIGKPKELWKIIKKLGLPDKNAPTTSVCLNTPFDIFFQDNCKHF